MDVLSSRYHSIPLLVKKLFLSLSVSLLFRTPSVLTGWSSVLRFVNDNGRLGGIVRWGLKVQFRLPRGVGSVTGKLFANGKKRRKIGEMDGLTGDKG